MLVKGVDVRVSDYDGLPIKNKLPPDLMDKFKTRKQWLEVGRVLSETATAVPMHPNAMNKKLVGYFHVDDVVEITDKAPRNCLTCATRNDNGFCPFAGAFVGEVNGCSEYEPKF